MMHDETIEFDPQGRMRYHPAYHTNQGKPWKSEDLKYLIDWYDKIGIEEMSFALGRTGTTIASKVNHLRRIGMMAPSTQVCYHKKFIKRKAV